MFKLQKPLSIPLTIILTSIPLMVLFVLFAMFIPGWLRLGPPGSYLIHRRFLELKAKSGNRDAMYQVAVEYSKIKMSYRDAALANEWYLKAAEHGHPEAVSLLANTEGWEFMNKKWMDIGINLKIESCLYRAAQAYNFGIGGFPKNPEMTKQLYAECDRIRILRMKLPYPEDKDSSLNGLEVENHFNAYRLKLESKFSPTHPEVAILISELYGGLDQDLSLQWLRRGAELDPACAHRLADAYQRGDYGLPEDKDAFYRWFTHARELENRKRTKGTK